MKNFKNLIPNIPVPPSTPAPSEKSGYNFPKSISFKEMQGIPSVEKIKKLIASNQSFSVLNIDIEALKKEFPIEQYMDENGKITCPVSKEDRIALMNKLP